MDKQQTAIRAAIEALEVVNQIGAISWNPDIKSSVVTALRLLREAGDGWEPIETAPKDGSLVDLWANFTHKQVRVPLCRRQQESEFWEFWCRDQDGELGWEKLLGIPTHWRPLPAPPEPLP